jgi:hypothetical protein
MQKIAGGISEEAAEFINIQDFPFLRRLGKTRRNKRSPFLSPTRRLSGCLVIFPGVADEFRGISKILRAESLEAVLDNDGVPYSAIRDFIALINIIQELAYQDGWGPGAVILDALPHIADMEPLPCREKALQE